MSTLLRFFGVTAYEFVTGKGIHILVDPYLEDAPISASDITRTHLILVTHSAVDHLGNTGIIAKQTGASVVCCREVKLYLMAKGVPEAQICTTTWGIALEFYGIRIRCNRDHKSRYEQNRYGGTGAGTWQDALSRDEPAGRRFGGSMAGNRYRSPMPLQLDG